MSTDPDTPPKERRFYRRTPVRLDVLWESESVYNFAQVADVSPAGCFVSTVFRARQGDGVTLDLLLPRGRNVRMTGVVAHEQWPAGFGVRFTGFGSDDDYGALLTLVR